MIPAITHQTAASADLSTDQAVLRARLMAQNPGWEHRFYTDADCRDLVRRAFPGLLTVYDAYPLAVQRADMFRVVALYVAGGVYLDLDVECALPLSPLTRHHCVLAEEKTLGAEEAAALGHAERLRIANYMFASAPGHPFWLELLGEMAARAGRPIRSDADVLESTGPGLLSTVYARAREAYRDIVVLPHPGRACLRCGGQSCQFGDFARHLHWGSWRAQVTSAAAHPAIPAPDLHFVVRGHVLGSNSLAMVNRAVARALEQQHPGRVRFDPVEHRPVTCLTGLTGVPSSERQAMEMMARRPAASEGATVTISQHYPVLPPSDPPPSDEAGLSLALVAWEESLVPARMTAAVSAGYDAVLATSTFTAKALIDSGVTIPVVSIGQPPDLSAFADIRAVKRRADEPFIFLHVSSGFPRKGLGVLLSAWARAFQRTDPVRLIIKTFPNPDNEAAAQVAAIWDKLPDCAEVEVIYRDFDQAALLDLYRRADAVVSPSRGEGYNLPALEAMAAGIPLIVTGHGGHLDFCGPDSARLIRHTMAFSTSHVASANALWAEPDEDDLVAALREMVDPAFAGVVAQRAARARGVAIAAADPRLWVGRLERLVAKLTANEPRRAPRIAWIGPRAARRPIGEAIDESDVDAVVIHHQAGLISWVDLSHLLADARATNKVSLAMLHDGADLQLIAQAERERVAAGLRQASRVLVHTLSEVNLLLDLGVRDNVTLLPHGAKKAADDWDAIGPHLEAIIEGLIQARRLQDDDAPPTGEVSGKLSTDVGVGLASSMPGPDFPSSKAAAIRFQL
jgi:glycosyltransferase involved in cell wall biosynthesis